MDICIRLRYWRVILTSGLTATFLGFIAAGIFNYYLEEGNIVWWHALIGLFCALTSAYYTINGFSYLTRSRNIIIDSKSITYPSYFGKNPRVILLEDIEEVRLREFRYRHHVSKFIAIKLKNQRLRILFNRKEFSSIQDYMKCARALQHLGNYIIADEALANFLQRNTR